MQVDYTQAGVFVISMDSYIDMMLNDIPNFLQNHYKVLFFLNCRLPSWDMVHLLLRRKTTGVCCAIMIPTQKLQIPTWNPTQNLWLLSPHWASNAIVKCQFRLTKSWMGQQQNQNTQTNVTQWSWPSKVCS